MSNKKDKGKDMVKMSLAAAAVITGHTDISEEVPYDDCEMFETIDLNSLENITKEEPELSLVMIQDMFRKVKGKDRVVIEIGTWSVVISSSTVEFGGTNGEYFHTVMSKHRDGTPTPILAMIDPFKDILRGFKGDVNKVFKDGYNKPHPLYVGA